MQLAERDRRPSLLISLDAEKAFARVHWGYLEVVVLEAFRLTGFRGQAIRAVYSNLRASVLPPGILSQPFFKSNGTQQGCPLSLVIFALVMEPFATAVREVDVSGVLVAKRTHKIGLYADDVLLILSELLRSLLAVAHIIQEFGNLSLYKVNQSKSQMLGINISKPLRDLISANTILLGAQ